MIKITILRVCLHLVMITIFISLVENSLFKYFEDKKSFLITNVDEEKVQYPSVTVCKRRAFDDKVDDLIHDNATKIEDIEGAVMENLTKKADIFYFVSQPHMSNSSHPCLTTRNSVDPGKPCIFPFKYMKRDEHFWLRMVWDTEFCWIKRLGLLFV